MGFLARLDSRRDVELLSKSVVPSSLTSVYSSGWPGYFGQILESYMGAWQQNVVVDAQPTLLAFSAVFCCVTGISSDIAKNRIKLVKKVGDIWEEIEDGSPYLPVLRKPNHYQNRIQFLRSWILSKLLSGNTYVLLERDNRGGEGMGVVRAMYVLDPRRVQVKVAEDSSVWYDLSMDNLSQVDGPLIVPASEIIHDRMPDLFHPLVGVSPLYACSVAATMGNKIQNTSTTFFQNRAQPGGMLTAPGRISQETADRMKAAFEEKFSGTNLGRLFVAGDGLKFEPFTMTAENAQLVDQFKLVVADVARAFHYPEYKLGGPLPPYSGNMQALDMLYYKECLQPLIEDIEECLDQGLGIGIAKGIGTELDTDNLLRMDTQSLMDSLEKGIRAAIYASNEARTKVGLRPVEGGESPLSQQQNYSLAALAKRDAQSDPFASKTPTQPPTPGSDTSSEPPDGANKGMDLDAIASFCDQELAAI